MSQVLLFTVVAFASLMSASGNGVSFTWDRSRGPRNVLGGDLEKCSDSPLTGFFRRGYCETGPEDYGTHTVCSRLTSEFLEFTKQRGNDLSTPRPEMRFPGLKPGDKWCLCASRWVEAQKAGVAPPIVLEASHEKTLAYVDESLLRASSIQDDNDGDDGRRDIARKL